MPDPEVVEGIVKGLSEPMKDALLHGFRVHHGIGTLRALHARKLVGNRVSFPDGNGWPATPLGLAVAQHLRNRILSEQE